ncbi:MAG: oxidoreductase [Verrucomicrobia bacterium]|nr:MAG: oxidoreductase [Verrucomicrobiota bacterium]
MKKEINWGILGTGNIAHAFAHGLQSSETGVLTAVASRRAETAERFAREFGVATTHADYRSLLADAAIDAVYISTPHPFHATWAIQCARADKHILCEKPITLNHADSMAVVEAAREAGVFLMEAFMYRCHPQTIKLVDLIHSGAIGEVQMIQAAFGFRAGLNPESRLLNNSLGGGGILDVGGYPVSLARLVAGAACGKNFADPVEVRGMGYLGSETRIDEFAAALLRFESGIIAQVSTGVRLQQDNSVRIYGTEGWIHMQNPWIPARDGGEWSFTLHRAGRNETETVSGSEPRGLYGVEADAFAHSIEAGRTLPPAMSPEDTLGNMETLDAWRNGFSFIYDEEKPDFNRPPVHRGPVEPAATNNMRYGRIAGLEKDISRLIMGVDNQSSLSHASVLFDDFYEKGGNTFDTAWIYGEGRTERFLGQWIRNRGLRDKVTLISKGAHTPFCDPESLTRELLESLDRLQTDHADIYIMHRDNPDIAVGEFVDVLNEHLKAGRIRIFGGSNWSLSRIEEANAYAEVNGLQGFSLVSNNFSLARMVDPVWDGCISASDPGSRDWLEARQMPLLAWSSQARGFFTDRADPGKTSDKDLVRCWYSEDNFRRKERAMELAGAKGVLPINIALAYVLSQPFPVFALFGPRTLEETRTSLPGLELELSPEELKYLNLETESV